MLSTEAAPVLESAVSATDEDARDYELLRRAICERDDEARAAKRRPSSSLDALLAANPDLPCPRSTDDPASEVFADLAAREVWDSIERELPNPADRLLVYLSFVSGLAPAAVCARYPQ